MNDCIEIRGKEYRVEANWRALTEYNKLRGDDTLEALQDLAKLSASDLALLMVCCINEGERLNGSKERVDVDFIDTMRVQEVTPILGKFLQIYVAQCSPDIPAEDGKKKE